MTAGDIARVLSRPLHVNWRMRTLIVAIMDGWYRIKSGMAAGIRTIVLAVDVRGHRCV